MQSDIKVESLKPISQPRPSEPTLYLFVLALLQLVSVLSSVSFVCVVYLATQVLFCFVFLLVCLFSAPVSQLSYSDITQIMFRQL